jgi:hypothetical protein
MSADAVSSIDDLSFGKGSSDPAMVNGQHAIRRVARLGDRIVGSRIQLIELLTSMLLT